MSDDNSDDFRVGYGKPPRHSQFKKGQSGNPKGRPKKPQTLKADLENELNRPVTIKVNGERIVVPTRKALVKQLTTKALNGDAWAFRLLVVLLDGEPDLTQGAAGLESPLSEADQEVLQGIFQRLLPSQGDISDGQTPI